MINNMKLVSVKIKLADYNKLNINQKIEYKFNTIQKYIGFKIVLVFTI